MTVLLLAIVLPLFFYLIFRFLVSHAGKKQEKEMQAAMTLHQKAGYPPLSNEKQFAMVETLDLSPIANLLPETKGKRVPHALMEHYITITFNDLSEHIRASGFVDNCLIKEGEESIRMESGSGLPVQNGK